VQASNDTYSEEERQSIAKEAEQIKQDLIDIANTKVNGKYIFNGTNTNEPPIAEDGSYTDHLNTNFVKIEVAPGTELEANVNPKSVFGKGESNMFEDIKSFINTLNGANQGKDLNQYIEDFNQRIDDVINARADLGARMNRLDLIEDRLGDQEIVATKMMSDNEDVDYAKAITELITQESIHRAALAAGSRIIQPSLVDFLR
ncbi:MAG TPA: flagellin, partial [Candidatus Dormibacteraeota bacterium]|nr:flagellin [Candidatus Dormibacteraeota bacterium]